MWTPGIDGYRDRDMPESFEEAFPGGFAECVSELSGREEIDDPEALCGWLQEHGFEAIANAEPETILADLSVEYVSVVDEPAQRSEWLLAKDEDGPDDDATRWTAPYLVRKLDNDGVDGEDEADHERKVWAAVLVPGESDKQADLVPEHEIESAAHGYLRDYRKVDEDHTLRDGAGVPIESYIVRGGPEEFETPAGEVVEYPEGTWIMGVEVGSEEWKKILDGDLNGFSIYGGASPVSTDDLLTAKQAAAIRSLSESAEQPAKQTTADAAAAALVLDSLDAYLSAGAEPADEIRAFAEWVAEDASDDTTADAVILDTSEDADEGDDPDGDEDEEADSDAEKQTETPMQDDPNPNDDPNDPNDDPNDPDNPDDEEQTNDLLKEVRNTVEETQKSVESHGERLNSLDNRVSSLETQDDGDGEEDPNDGGGDDDGNDQHEEAPTTEDVEEAAEKAATKAVESSFRDLFGADEDENLDDVVRKYEFEEQRRESEGLNLSLDGITESERA